MREDTHYALGSVLNHVLLHQTVIGAKAGWSEPGNRCRMSWLAALEEDQTLPVLPSHSCAIKSPVTNKPCALWPANYLLSHVDQGRYRYDFGDAIGMTPLMPMHTLGHNFVPAKIHAGGLRYRGAAPLVSHALRAGRYRSPGLPSDRVF